MREKFGKPSSFLLKLKSVFSKPAMNECFDDVEEILIESDMDLGIVDEMMDRLRSRKKTSFIEAKAFLKEEFIKRLNDGAGIPDFRPGLNVIIMAGVNGAGKTTTASKLAKLYAGRGKKVAFAAADTFRAAAVEQLSVWAEKTGVDITAGMDGADPASVVFDGISKAKKSGAGLLIVDTAGRLHTSANLMNEIIKIKNVILKEVPEDNVFPLITIDTNTGKNSAVQAARFNDALVLKGIILTKFDSSAKGGSIIKIKDEFKLPITHITFGEGIDDIEEFAPGKFVDELFG